MSRCHPTHNSTLTQPQQQRKIFCAYHPHQTLTNFCCDMECLMPLCPNCIVQHTEQHFLQNNKPTYVNVTQAITQTKQKCYQNIIIFQELSKSNDKIYDYITGLRQSIHNQLTEDKQQIFREIDLLFQNYQEKLLGETIGHYKELDVYDRKETANISQFITEQVEIIQEQINVMKGDNCLAGLINFYKHDGLVYEESIRDITQYVQKHRNAGKISIDADPHKLRQALEGFCEQNLQVEFINEETLREEEQRMKASNVSKQGCRSVSQRMTRQPSGNHLNDHIKENNFNQINQEYRNMVKKSEQYYKIDAVELKPNKVQSINPLPPNYHRQQAGFRHRF